MWYENLSAADLLQELSVRIYESPILDRRLGNSWSPNQCLADVILFLDFDTEVSMQGIHGFLENSTGRHLPETIKMFRSVGAVATEAILLNVQEVMARHGITVFRLREDFEGHDEFEITSYAALHGPAAVQMAEEISQVADSLYLYRSAGENVYALVRDYIAAHQGEIVSALREAGA